MTESPLAQWLLGQIGRGGRFKSPRQLSLAAGLNQNSVSQVIERGRGEPETLLKLGEALGKTPEEMFTLAGWLPKPTVPASSPARRRLLAAFDRIEDTSLQDAVIQVAEALQGLPPAAALTYRQTQTPAALRVADRPAEKE